MQSLTAAASQEDLDLFLDGYMYRDAAVLIDRVLSLDLDAGSLEAELDTVRPLAYSALQCTTEDHPLHVSAGDLLMATGTMACLYAWIALGCKWDQGWAGFGSRVHRADFKRMVRVGPPLHMHMQQTAVRKGSKRVMLRCDLRFTQEGLPTYIADQTAMFVRGVSFFAG
jgi:hypothetical protein